MSSFSADWLAMREPVDACSRSAALVQQLGKDAPPGRRRIVDLATGTGANLRYLAPRLGGQQDWLLVDNDGVLLDGIEDQLARWATTTGLNLRRHGETLSLRSPSMECRVKRQQLDLARDLRHLDLEGQWLVTASALLDLVTQSWLDSLLARCRAVGARLLFALTYDGVARFSPAFPEDARINTLLNRHQRRDKGFGPALGPHAAVAAAEGCRRWGYRVAEARTPWHVGRAGAALQRALVQDWARAAVELTPAEAEQVARWRHRRDRHAEAGMSSLYVGHRDLLAWPVLEQR